MASHLVQFCGAVVAVLLTAAVVTVIMAVVSRSRSPSDPTGSRVTDTLKFVAIVSRHGNRNSNADYPGDPYPINDTYYWPYGEFSFTPHGRVQMYNLGVKVRSLYNGFLNSTLFSEELHASSTYMDRLLMSGEGFLAGLYPPKGFQIWDKDMKWQPSAIYSDSPDKTITIQSECKRFLEDFVQLIIMFPTSYSANISEMGDYYNQVTGSNATGEDALNNLYYLWDKLLSEDTEGYAVPEWTKELYPQPLQDLIAELSIDFFAGTEEMARLLIGKVFGEIVDAMQGKVNGSLPDRRLQYYSGHDSSLLALQVILGIPRESIIGMVKCGSALILELHSTENTSQYTVQALYIDGSSADLEPRNLTTPNCGDPCDFATLVSNTEWFTNYTYESECLNLTTASTSLSYTSQLFNIFHYV